jgi:predicted  nucleic acid-binding Zn-ribbon protein
MGSDLEALLVVQELDVATDQLRHRREHLDDRAALIARRADHQRVESALARIGARRTELGAHQDRLERDIDQVREKAAGVDRTMYGGSVRNPRELMDLQEELEALGRRQRVLEDQELEVMEQLEPVEAELVSLRAERAELDDVIGGLEERVAEAEAEIDEQLADLAERRLAAIAPVAPEVLDEYDRLRERLGGVGVARLVGDSCAGCHLTLPRVEVDRIRHGEAGPTVHCSECGRLLVP